MQQTETHTHRNTQKHTQTHTNTTHTSHTNTNTHQTHTEHRTQKHSTQNVGLNMLFAQVETKMVRPRIQGGRAAHSPGSGIFLPRRLQGRTRKFGRVGFELNSRRQGKRHASGPVLAAKSFPRSIAIGDCSQSERFAPKRTCLEVVLPLAPNASHQTASRWQNLPRKVGGEDCTIHRREKESAEACAVARTPVVRKRRHIDQDRKAAGVGDVGRALHCQTSVGKWRSGTWQFEHVESAHQS